MANLASPLTTYSDTTPQKRIITDVISLIDPADTPFIEALGGLDGASSKFQFVNGAGTKMEWLEDTLTPLSGTLANAATIASTDTTLTVADPNMVQEGHVLLIDSEYVWVSAKSGSDLTITRAYAGTAATHASLASFTVKGMARLEGDDSDDLGFTDRTTNYNYTQILHQEVRASRTQRQISQYGISDEFEYQAKKVVPSLVRLLEIGLIHGQRKQGSATTPRAFGGLLTFITDNLVSGATLAQSQFEAAVMSAFQDGGSGPWLAQVSPTNFQKIKNFYDSSAYLRIDRTESTVGMVIKDIITPFGQVTLVMDRWASDSYIPIVDPKHAGFKTFYPFTMEMLSKTGDADKGEVVGEFTLCVRQDKAHSVLTNVS